MANGNERRIPALPITPIVPVSGETDIKIAKLEVHFEGLKEKSDETNLMVRNLDTKTSALYSNLDTKIDNLPKEFSKQYAGKLVERIVYAMIGVILLAFMSGIIYLVIPRR